ncbi:MAG: NADPH:quinone reductase [Elusimicrobia bacterium]|nr:NADPH:quinone reductase [Elusimicrobiota bacterium]
MKAVVFRQFGEPEVLRLEEIDPPKPQSGEVLVRIRAAGVNPVDAYRRAGTHSYRPPLPATPGFDGAGVVERSQAPGLVEGMRVWVSASTSGTYAEYAACPADAVHPLPQGLSFSQGAAVGIPYLTAYRALFVRAKAAPGETVLVHGASGGVGLAALQLARAAGLRVAGTAGTPRGLDLVLREGAHAAFDHSKHGYLDEALDWTKKTGFNVILEMLANVNLAKDLSVVARFGRIAVIGSRGPVEIDPREAMTRDASILGMTLRNATAEEKPRIDAAVQAGLEDGTLKPVVGLELPLAEAAESHRAVMRSGAHGKIVLLA